MSTILIGASTGTITPELGTGMGGYVARTGPADSVVDHLRCRVAVFTAGTDTVAIVVLDVLYMPKRLAENIADTVASAAGTRSRNVMVAATHTHCGPAMADKPFNDQLFEQFVHTAGDTARNAVIGQRACRLYETTFPLSGLVNNRRNPDEPIEQEGIILLAVDDTTSQPVLTLVNVACHPTVLEADTTGLSPDYPGTVCATVEMVCGGTAMFIQGFAGNINPTFHNHTVDDMRLFGVEMGARAAAATAETARDALENLTMNLSQETELPTHRRKRKPVNVPHIRAQWHDSPVRSKPTLAADSIKQRLRSAERQLIQAVNQEDRVQAAAEHVYWWIEDLISADAPYLGLDLPPAGDSTLPVQVISLGPDLHIVALPGEPLNSAATDLKKRVGGTLLLAGCANQSAGYLPAAHDFPHYGYEVGSTRYAAGTLEKLCDTAATIVNSLH